MVFLYSARTRWRRFGPTRLRLRLVTSRAQAVSNLRGARGQRLPRLFQRTLDLGRLGMRRSEYARPRRCDGLERRHGLAMIIERRVEAGASPGQHHEAAEARAEGVAILEAASRTSRRVFGPSHPMTVDIELVLTRARRILTIK